MSSAIVFEIGSSFGYFRKSFTTTHAITHSVIPRSSVVGIIGSIIGLSRDEYSQMLLSSKIAIELKSPIRKLTMKYSHINHDWWENNIPDYLKGKIDLNKEKSTKFSVPVSAELLVSPKYIIYFDNPEFNKLLNNQLIQRQTYYTPFLGSSSMICYIKYLGQYEYHSHDASEQYVSVKSVISFSDKVPKIKVSPDFRFAIEESLTTHIDNQRRSLGFYNIIFSPNAEPLEVIDTDIVAFEINKERTYVKFIPSTISP